MIFDCDGVLVDSEPASMTAWAAALTDLGISATPEDIHRWIGHTDLEIAEHYSVTLDLEPDRVLDHANGRLQDLLTREGLKPFADALELLGTAENLGLSIGCATNSSRRRLDWLLAAASLDTRFEATVAADEVPAPKPRPDVYDEALRRLGVSAARTVVIEDSPVGIAAGLGAGCTVIAVDRGVFDVGLLSAAHRVVASLG